MADVPTQEELVKAFQTRNARLGRTDMVGIVQDRGRLPQIIQDMIDSYMPTWMENEWGGPVGAVMTKEIHNQSDVVASRIREAFRKIEAERRFR